MEGELNYPTTDSRYEIGIFKNRFNPKPMERIQTHVYYVNEFTKGAFELAENIGNLAAFMRYKYAHFIQTFPGVSKPHIYKRLLMADCITNARRK